MKAADQWMLIGGFFCFWGIFMEVVVKVVVVVVPVVFVAMLIGGCTAPRVREDKALFDAYIRGNGNYLADKGYDLLDVFTLSVEGPVIGASAVLGPVKVGAMRSSHPTLEGKGGIGIGLGTEPRLTGFGLRYGQVGSYAQEENFIGVALDTPPEYASDTRASIRGKTKRWDNKKGYKRSQYGRIGVAAGVGVGLRAEFNFGELADLLLGFAGIDLMKDDLGRISRRKLFTKTELFLDQEHLGVLPTQIGDFTQLQRLLLAGDDLVALPDTFANLKELRELGLYDNKFKQFPPALASLQKLEKLSMTRNSLEGTLSPEIGKLSALTYLSLSDNQLDGLPEEIGELRMLRNLDAENNRLRSIPRGIGNLALVELRLANNSIERLPAEIGNLEKLSYLDLNKNSIERLPAEMGNLTKLETLYLNKNSLVELPPEMGKLASLRRLELQENRLHDLPRELGHLHSLSELNLSQNPLEKIPSAIFDMEGLTDLSLDGAGIMEIPEEIAHLSNLRNLNLWNNMITTVPADALAKLPNLQNVHLGKNSLSCEEMRRVRKILGYRVSFGGWMEERDKCGDAGL